MIKKGIVVIGSSNTDLTIYGTKLPGPGETVLGDELIIGPGGKGANQAVAVKRLGGNMVFVCKVGSDMFGDKAIENYSKEGIDTAYVLKSQKPSGIAMITVDANAENRIIVAPGANDDLTPEDIRKQEGVIKEADYLLLQLEIPLESVLEAARIAKENNVKVILNPAPARELPEELYKMLYLILPNESEASLLTGINITDESKETEAAEILHSKGVENVIITLGKRGALLLEGNTCEVIPTRKIHTVDTTAAGDTFCGAICVALSESQELRDAVRFANAAASVSVQRKGAQNSIPVRNEVETILE